MSAQVFSTRNQQIISLICLCLFDKILNEKIAKFRLSSLHGGFLAVLLWVLFSFLQLMWMAGVHWWRKNTQEELDMQASGKIGQATTASQAPNTQNRMRKHRLSHSSCWPLHLDAQGLCVASLCVWHSLALRRHVVHHCNILLLAHPSSSGISQSSISPKSFHDIQ